MASQSFRGAWHDSHKRLIIHDGSPKMVEITDGQLSVKAELAPRYVLIHDSYIGLSVGVNWGTSMNIRIDDFDRQAVLAALRPEA